MEEKEFKTPERQRTYQKRYDAKHECMTIRFPVGTKEKITSLGYTSIAKFTLMAVAEKIARDEASLGK